MPTIVWLITITGLSGYPGSKIPDIPIVNFDKLVHVGIYFVLSLLLSYGFYKSGLNNKGLIINVVIVFFGIFYGGFMEILQHYIFINRNGNWFDFFANAVGAILGIFFLPLIVKWLPFKS